MLKLQTPSYKLTSHVAVKLLLVVFGAERFALESTQTLETTTRLAHVHAALAHQLDEAGFLDLLLEALLEAVIGFFAVLVCVDSHRERSAPAHRSFNSGGGGIVGMVRFAVKALLGAMQQRPYGSRS